MKLFKFEKVLQFRVTQSLFLLSASRKSKRSGYYKMESKPLASFMSTQSETLSWHFVLNTEVIISRGCMYSWSYPRYNPKYVTHYSNFTWPQSCGPFAVCYSRLNGRKGFRRLVIYGKVFCCRTLYSFTFKGTFYIRLRFVCWLFELRLDEKQHGGTKQWTPC